VNDTPVGAPIRREFVRLDENGAVVTGVMHGGEAAANMRVSVRPRSGIALFVADANDGYEHDHAVWADAAFDCETGQVYVSQLEPETARHGSGGLTRDKNLLDLPIRIAGHVYQHGLGTSADSEIVYAVPPGCTAFVASVGIDDASNNRGTVQFAVRQTVSRAELAEKVKAALASDPLVGKVGIDVNVEGDAVRLSSDQTNREERERAVGIASAVAGVAKVEDQMK
jgi:hypothetical protein